VRILLITQYFWPESFLVNDLAVGLSHYGHEVSVLTGVPNYPSGKFYPGYRCFPKDENYQGVRVLRVPLIPRGPATRLRLALNYLSFALMASLLLPWKYRQRPDAVIVFQPSPVTVGIPALVVRALRGSPIYFWVQDLWPDCLELTGIGAAAWQSRCIDRFVRWLYARCYRVLVQSSGFAEYVRIQGVPESKIVWMPNWADSFYQPVVLEEAASELRELPSGFRVIYGGNIGEAQGWRTWVEAATFTQHRSDIHWVIIGGGRQQQALAAEVERRGLRGTVHLLGPRPATAMPRYFAAADALLVTLRRSPALARTIPSKVQAYLACGRPIVAALDGDGGEVIRGAEAGIVVPAENAQQLATAVLHMAAMSGAERAAMGCRARAYYEANFSREQLLYRWHKLLTENPSRNVELESKRCAA
jgi:colanic acid biosynthesis glycosyl transferase WcaI